MLKHYQGKNNKVVTLFLGGRRENIFLPHRQLGEETTLRYPVLPGTSIFGC